MNSSARAMALAAAVFLATGCSQSEEAAESAPAQTDVFYQTRTPGAPPPPVADAEVASAMAEAPARAFPEPRPVAQALPVSAPMLAYRYEYGIETPADALRGLIKAHEAACTAAGPAVCQMVGQSVRAEGKDRLAGELSLRATPAWLNRFRDGLEAQARKAGGRVIENTTESEDLTRQIVDTEAGLRAKTTLRDRLQAVLATRPGKLSELLEVERELARVQEEIDATQSALAVMRTRVATSALTIRYRSTGVLAAEGVFTPLGRAFGDVVAIFVGTLAVMVRVIAFALPWALIIGGGLWLMRKRIPWPKPKAKADPPVQT